MCGGGGGGIISTVATVVAAIASGGNPLVVAAVSAATTKATGGSWRDALVAGATSYATTSLGNYASGQLSGIPTGGADAAFNIPATGGEFATSAISAPATATLGNTTLATTAPSIFGGASAGSVLDKIGGTTLANLGGMATGGIAEYVLQNSVADALKDPTGVGMQALRTGAGMSEPELKALTAEQRTRDLNTAYTTAQQQARSAVEGRGLGYDEYKTIVENVLNQQKGSIPEAENTNFGRYFDPTSYSNALNTEQERRRTEYTGKINSFAPLNFENTMFGDTADDSVVSEIVGNQRRDAESTINQARARGQLSDTGFNTAMSELEGQNQSAMTRANTLGGDILNRYRSTLGGIRNEGLAGAGGYSLGQQFNPDAYSSRIADTSAGLRSSLAGDVRGVIPSGGLFDTQSILQKAGSTQGATNSSGILDVLATRNRRSTQRGLGTTGAF